MGAPIISTYYDLNSLQRSYICKSCCVEKHKYEKPKGSRAEANYIRSSPNKVRRVLNTIRGRKYWEALMILRFMPYRACEPILKCLISAASNAKTEFSVNKKDLFIKGAYCNQGPTLKRRRYCPRGQV